MKKLLCILLASILIFSLVACTGTSKYDVETQQPETEESAEGQQEVAEEIPGSPDHVNLNTFIEKYNAIAATPITNTEVIDIQSDEYYRTEFRLNAFQNAPSYKGNIGTTTIELINNNYEGYFGSDLRIYAFADSIETTIDIFESFCKAVDPEITQEDFDEFYKYDQLDAGDCRIVIKQISGYVMVKDKGFDILLDGSPDYFENKEQD